MHIAMWSGPRNLSTALMYSFAARPDFNIVDEPFYGAFLALTGADHPMREDVMASLETDASRVATALSKCGEAKHLYSKQMTHHMVEGIPTGWFETAKHAFLIRHPARVLASYLKKREQPALEDLGFAQQEKILKQVQALGQRPIVLDSFDIRQDPERVLRATCLHFDLPWNASMLNWPQGGHASDGVWAKHWYGAVHASSGFAGPEGPLPSLLGEAQRLVDLAMPYYLRMRALV